MKKYQIIYADPPWDMGKGNNARVLPPSYAVMKDNDILALPISCLVAYNSALFLWTINSKLPVGLKLIEQWGFRYVGIAFCWVKTSRQTGMPNCRMSGNYTLQGMELCLLGIRGHLIVMDRTTRQVIQSPRECHSKKPSIIRNEIIRLFGDLPRIELFARQKVEGWDCWGNEVESDIELGLGV